MRTQKYPMNFTQYECGHGMISIPASMLMTIISTRWVDEYEFGWVLPIPTYSWVKYTHIIPL
jgi:hypothetical protein